MTGRAATSRTSPTDLASAYAHCRRVAARHGSSFTLAARLLPADERPAVHALYAFARSVDDFVDTPPPGSAPADVARRLDRLRSAVASALAQRPTAPRQRAGAALPGIDERIAAAFLDSARRLGIDPEYIDAFLRSMRMDVPGTESHTSRYRTMTELHRYMHGSAEVIGLQMLPVLGAGPDAAEPAAALGTAFQMTNFLRDVGEDLDRGRIYLPLDEFAAFGVDENLLARTRRTGEPDARVRAALAHFIALARASYRSAAPGIAMLDTRPRMCVGAAIAVYSEILGAIEASGYRVFDRRIVVPRRRRYPLAVRAAATATATLPIRKPWPAPAAGPRGHCGRAARRPDAPGASDHP